VKTIVFQGTFLLGLVAATALLAFPFAEVLAALRMAYHPADQAWVQSRKEYLLRSLALFRVAGANWLYGGAMIGSLSAITVLSTAGGRPLVEQILYILGPSLIGFGGYWITRRHVRGYLSHSPAVVQMLAERVRECRAQQAVAEREQLERANYRRLLQLAVPVACILGYLLWTGSGVHQQAVRQLIMPVSAKGWLLILPYALLVPVLLVRDRVQLFRLRRQKPDAPSEGMAVEADPAGSANT
jgi:hypothetical protein